MTNQLTPTRYDQEYPTVVAEDFFTRTEADLICEAEDSLTTLFGNSNAYTTNVQNFIEGNFNRSYKDWTNWSAEWL